ncbi:FAD dependent oxidoreductase [Dactylonectria estremocensis]|uniref:FAD dependent oxidoreductase n=1 Tax=Dactylonectria estremocensis TaxID=1079267 RepID=A0A9P9EHT8_9HYPO|nr:FAD dependent oxidoreductase [Dactylonectria estremocensis]
MSSSFFPALNGMKSFWRKDPGSLDNFRSSPELPEEPDIVVIGAGYSGAAIVTHILATASSPTKPLILVLEARELCSGATGRNGGHLKPDSYNAISAYASEYGIEAAAEVANFESENVKAVTEYIRREKVDCDFVLTRAVDVQLSAKHQTQIQGGYETLLSAGVEATQATFSVSAEGAESMSGVKGAKGCFTYTAGHLWPYKLTHHMFSQAIEQGVNVQTNTSVTSISSAQDENGKWVLETSRGTIKSKRLVFATNAYTGALLPEYSTKIIPYRGVCCRIKTPEKRPFLNNTYAIRFSDKEFDYLIPRLDGSIIVGGAHRTYIRDTKEWYGNVDDTKMMEQARSYFDGYMQRHFIGWEDSGAYVDDIWTGIMGFSSDRLPRVGPIPDRPGMFIMGGFSGHGMPQIFLCARGIAQMVGGGQSYARTGLPRLFEETRARLDDPRDRVREMADPVKVSKL